MIEVFGEHIAPCDPVVIPFVPDIESVRELFGGEDMGDPFAFFGFFPLSVSCGEKDKAFSEQVELTPLHGGVGVRAADVLDQARHDLSLMASVRAAEVSLQQLTRTN